jgi:hypothetical protein
MGEKPNEEILVPPEFSILEFGDGYIALMQGAIKTIDNDGKEIVEMWIKPSELLKKRYNIKDSQLNQNGALKFKVYRKDLIPLNEFDDANRKWIYVKTYNHDETEISKLGWNLKRRLEEMEKRVMVLEGELIWLSEQLQLAKTNPAEFIAQGTEVFENISSKMFNLMNRPRGGDKDNIQ